MGYFVRLIVPTDNEQSIVSIVGRIVGHWGGCTVTTGYGWWQGKDGYVKDKVSIIECSIGVWDGPTRTWWHDLADAVRVEWDQESVFLSVAAGISFFVTGPDANEMETLSG